jgi:hypothetical protein
MRQRVAGNQLVDIRLRFGGTLCLRIVANNPVAVKSERRRFDYNLGGSKEYYVQQKYSTHFSYGVTHNNGRQMTTGIISIIKAAPQPRSEAANTPPHANPRACPTGMARKYMASHMPRLAGGAWVSM